MSKLLLFVELAFIVSFSFSSPVENESNTRIKKDNDNVQDKNGLKKNNTRDAENTENIKFDPSMYSIYNEQVMYPYLTPHNIALGTSSVPSYYMNSPYYMNPYTTSVASPQWSQWLQPTYKTAEGKIFIPKRKHFPFLQPPPTYISYPIPHQAVRPFAQQLYMQPLNPYNSHGQSIYPYNSNEQLAYSEYNPYYRLSDSDEGKRFFIYPDQTMSSAINYKTPYIAEKSLEKTINEQRMSPSIARIPAMLECSLKPLPTSENTALLNELNREANSWEIPNYSDPVVYNVAPFNKGGYDYFEELRKRQFPTENMKHIPIANDNIQPLSTGRAASDESKSDDYNIFQTIQNDTPNISPEDYVYMEMNSANTNQNNPIAHLRSGNDLVSSPVEQMKAIDMPIVYNVPNNQISEPKTESISENMVKEYLQNYFRSLAWQQYQQFNNMYSPYRVNGVKSAVDDTKYPWYGAKNWNDEVPLKPFDNKTQNEMPNDLKTEEKANGIAKMENKNTNKT
ncbi:hypothetical protein PGB90_003184 [Kerria lacca]